MSAYNNDSRVKKERGGYTVTATEGTAVKVGRVEKAGRIWRSFWTTGPRNEATHDTADDAIFSFIGRPR